MLLLLLLPLLVLSILSSDDAVDAPARTLTSDKRAMRGACCREREREGDRNIPLRECY